MISPSPSHRPALHRRLLARVLAGGAAASLLGMAGWSPAEAAPQAPKGLVWTVSWDAPVTVAGPNRFSGPPELRGTAKYLLGRISRVDYTVSAPAGLPAGCGTFPQAGVAALSGNAFTVTPDLPCNGTYTVSVVAQSGSGMLAARSSALTAPVALADPGGAISGARGAVDGATRTVSLAWTAEADPDVTGYVIRRDGEPVGEVDRSQSTWEGKAPGVGTYAYDISARRWGDAGPASLPLTSPPSAPLTATIDPAAPPRPTEGGGGGGGSGSPSGGGSGGSPATPGAGGGAAPAGGLPKAPSAEAKVDPRAGYRSGGTISSSSSSRRGTGASSSAANGTAEEPDVYEERLPYEDQTSVRGVEVASPGRTETVRSTVAVPSRTKPGLMVPVAVVLVLLAAALQVRSLLGRASAGLDGGTEAS